VKDIRTIYARGKLLSADFAVQKTNALLLFHFHRDGFLVVAEETLEGGWERFILYFH
jgi:hypothetical protein